MTQCPCEECTKTCPGREQYRCSRYLHWYRITWKEVTGPFRRIQKIRDERKKKNESKVR